MRRALGVWVMVGLASVGCDDAAKGVEEEADTRVADTLEVADIPVDVLDVEEDTETSPDETVEPQPIAVEGTWYGGEAIGGCVDEAFWLRMGPEDAFEYGHINSNACMAEELRGVDRCLGSFVFDGRTLRMNCTSTREPALFYPELVVETSAVVGDTEIELGVFSALPGARWERKLRADYTRTFFDLNASETGTFDHTVALAITGWDGASAGDVLPVSVEVVLMRTVQADVLVSLETTFDYVAVRREGGLVAHVAADADDPAGAWRAFLIEVLGDTTEAGELMMMLPHELSFTEAGFFVSMDGWAPLMPMSWRGGVDDDPCVMYAGMRSYNAELDAWCAGK